VVYHIADEQQSQNSSYGTDMYGIEWDAKTVGCMVFFFGAAFVSLVCSVYDLVDLRRASVRGDDEEGGYRG
jgi:hypothetical protein